MHILSVKDPAFRKYGRVITNVDFTQLVEEMKKTPVPDGVVYEPGINALEALPVKKELETITYGEMPVQIGYCNGHNSKLNAVEYHRSSEINVAATDAILILGLLADVAEDFTYDTSKMEAFLVPAGTGVEVFATSLHYAPCGVDGQGFQVAIVLPQGTNTSEGGAGQGTQRGCAACRYEQMADRPCGGWTSRGKLPRACWRESGCQQIMVAE